MVQKYIAYFVLSHHCFLSEAEVHIHLFRNEKMMSVFLFLHRFGLNQVFDAFIGECDNISGLFGMKLVEGVFMRFFQRLSTTVVEIYAFLRNKQLEVL